MPDSNPPREAYLLHAKLELAPPVEGSPKRQIKILAYSGQPIADHWFWGNLAIDLAGIQIPPKSLPMLQDHDTSKRLGTLRDFAVTENGFEAIGEFLTTNPDARQALLDAQDGFPWQASVYVEPGKMTQVAAGETVNVNGHDVVGPGMVFSTSRLREISLCPLGADAATSAELLSKGGVQMAEKKDSVQPAPEPNLDEIRKAAVLAERERVTAILQVAHPKQHDLAVKLAADGADLMAAVSALYEGLKAIVDQMLATIEAYTAENAPAPEEGEGDSGGGDEGEGAPFSAEPAGKRKPLGAPKPVVATADPDARFKLEWKQNPELQKQVDEKSYVLLRRKEVSGAVSYVSSAKESN